MEVRRLHFIFSVLNVERAERWVVVTDYEDTAHQMSIHHVAT